MTLNPPIWKEYAITNYFKLFLYLYFRFMH